MLSQRDCSPLQSRKKCKIPESSKGDPSSKVFRFGNLTLVGGFSQKGRVTDGNLQNAEFVPTVLEFVSLKICIVSDLLSFINPFHPTGLFLYSLPPKTISFF